VISGHASVQNVRRGHCELAVDEPVNLRLAVAFDELALAMGRAARPRAACRACGAQRRLDSRKRDSAILGLASLSGPGRRLTVRPN
jgi:hypothetical protein